MQDGPLLMTVDPPVAEIVLNRPARKNALTQAMWAALPDLVRRAEADRAVKVLILRGAGGAFAAGADIAEFERVYATRASAAAYSQDVAAAMEALAQCTKPSVAMISGACVGGGCGLALACDLRISDKTAKLGITPGRLGLVYSLADTRRLVNAVGMAMAKDILYTGRLLDPAEALSCGLIDRLVAPGDLEDAVRNLAADISAASQFSARATKRILTLIGQGETADTEETRALFLDAFEGEDFQEAYRAFLDKRPPRFTFS